MHSTPTLATRFARTTGVVRSDVPLAEEQMRLAAPSIFAIGKHQSRSERYAYIRPAIRRKTAKNHRSGNPASAR